MFIGRCISSFETSLSMWVWFCLFAFSMFNVLNSLYILEAHPLSDTSLEKIFSHSAGCLFTWSSFLCWTKPFQFYEIPSVDYLTYLMSNQSPIQKVLTYAYNFKNTAIFILLTCKWMQLPTKSRRRHWIPWSWSYRHLWFPTRAPGSEFRSSDER